MDRAAGWNLCLIIATYEYFIYLKFRELKRLHGRQPVVSGLSLGEGELSEQGNLVSKPRKSPQDKKNGEQN